MKLYLVRHAPAVERRPGRPDAGRALTGRGAARMRRVAAAMRRLGVEPGAIYTSPLLRARQTAGILARALRLPAPPRLAAGLRPAASPRLLLRAIAAGNGRSGLDVMLVGHEPDLGRLLSLLVAGHTRAAFRLRKCGFCRLDVPTGRLRAGRCATLEWLIAPRLALAAGRARPSTSGSR